MEVTGQLHALLLHTQESPPLPPELQAPWIQQPYGHFKEWKNLLPLPGLKTMGHQTHNLVTTPTTLSWLVALHSEKLKVFVKWLESQEVIKVYAKIHRKSEGGKKKGRKY
jgi:hypothetical protein